MSQEKVDLYKKEKANRKKNIKKEKRNKILKRLAAGLGVVAIIAVLVASVVMSNKQDDTITLSQEELQSLIDSINAGTTTGADETTKKSKTTKEGETNTITGESTSSDENTTSSETTAQ